VIKMEYRRALHQNAIPTSRQPVIPSFPAQKKPSISSFPTAFLPGSAQYVESDVTHSKQTTATFLPGSRIASHGLRQGTALAVPSLVCPGEEGAIHYSFRAGSPARAFARTLDPDTATVDFSSFLPGATTEQCHAPGTLNSAFLTGSDTQTEFDVTHSKQTTKKFLGKYPLTSSKPF
jgi:hypothetical protein